MSVCVRQVTLLGHPKNYAKKLSKKISEKLLNNYSKNTKKIILNKKIARVSEFEKLFKKPIKK